jgi:CheY-like chemotaxis protein
MTGFRILIVDDQRDARRMFADALQTLGPGMDVVELPSGEEALLVAFRKVFHLLITDIKLPGISGFDLVKRIRKNNPDLKIILVTGYSDPEIKEQADQAAADAFFYKPVPIGQLLDAAKACLGTGEMAATAVESRPEKPEEAPAPLAETHPVVVPVKEKATAELDAYLASLFEQLKAQAVVLFDLQGNVLSQTGDITPSVDSRLISRLITALKDSQDISLSLNPGSPASLLCFTGDKNSLCMVPVGSEQALLVAGGQAFQASLLNSGRRITSAAGELQELLATLKAPPEAAKEVSTPVAEPIEEALGEPSPEDLAALDVLFSQDAEKKLQSTDLDAFWGSLAEEIKTPGGESEGILSYEEARKMGLAPE